MVALWRCGKDIEGGRFGGDRRLGDDLDVQCSLAFAGVWRGAIGGGGDDCGLERTACAVEEAHEVADADALDLERVRCLVAVDEEDLILRVRGMCWWEMDGVGVHEFAPSENRVSTPCGGGRK